MLLLCFTSVLYFCALLLCLSALLADVIPFMSSFPFRAKVVLEMAQTNYKPELQIIVGHRTVGDKI